MKILIWIFTLYLSLFSLFPPFFQSKLINEVEQPRVYEKLENNHKTNKIIDEILTSKEINKKYEIIIPKMLGIKDKVKENKLNSLIVKNSLKILNLYKHKDSYDMKVNYNISLLNNNVLSVIYRGAVMFDDTAHPNQIYYSINIDLKNEKILKLSDIVIVDEKLVMGFKNRKFKSLWKAQGEAIDFNKMDIDYIKQNFENSDSFSPYKDNWFSYLKSDSLVVVMPVTYALGGYACFSIPFEKIKMNLNLKLY